MRVFRRNAPDRERSFSVRSGRAGGDRVRLNVFDLVTGTIYTQRAFFYRQTLDGEALRASLARTLLRYPVMSGRLERDADGGLSVRCDDSGVLFVEEEAEEGGEPMRDYGPAGPARPPLRHLVPQVIPLRVAGRDVPMLTVKLTHTAGGGSILGVGMNHVIVDGRGYVAFMENWSREHLGLPYPEPCHDRHLIDALGASAPPEATRESERFVVPRRREKLALLTRINGGARKLTTPILRFSAAETRAMKEAAMADLAGSGAWVSTNDALTAHVWKVLGELRARPDDSRETLGLIAEISGVFGDDLPEHYWGNTITSTLPAMTAGELRSRPLGDVAKVVRDGLRRNTREKVRDEIGYLLARRAEGVSRRVMPRMPFDAFSSTVQLNNWSKLPLYRVDFGGGAPSWCELPDMPIPWMVHIVPTPEKEDSLDVHISMPRERADELTRERSWQERLHRYAASPPVPG